MLVKTTVKIISEGWELFVKLFVICSGTLSRAMCLFFHRMKKQLSLFFICVLLRDTACSALRWDALVATSYNQSIIALARLSKGMRFIEDRFVKFNVCIERSVTSLQHGYYCIKMRIPWMSIRPKAKFDTLTWLHIRVNSRREKKPEEKGKIVKSAKGVACVHSWTGIKIKGLLSVSPTRTDTIFLLSHQTYQASITRITPRCMYDSFFNRIFKTENNCNNDCISLIWYTFVLYIHIKKKYIYIC